MKLQEKAKWSVGTALSRIMVNNRLEDTSELVEAANLLQGPSPFPTPAPASTYSTTHTTLAGNAIDGTTPTNVHSTTEFDFRPYLDNQYFEPGSYNDQAGIGSSAESFLPPQDFERLFSDPVKPSLCPSALMNARDMLQDYPLELLRLPGEIVECDPVVV